jgi:hypothetical protein
MYILSKQSSLQHHIQFSLTADQLAYLMEFASCSRSVPIYIQISTTGFDSISFASSAINIDKCFDLRPSSGVSHIKGQSLALHMLKSYPEMISRRETLPPFIHRHGYPSDSDYDLFPSFLENAMLIVSKLYGSDKSSTTRASVWHSIRMEIIKIFETVGSLLLGSSVTNDSSTTILMTGKSWLPYKR